MEKTVVIGLTGMAGSGKSTAGRYLKEKYGFEFIVMSDIIRAEAERRGFLKHTDLEAQKAIISKFGVLWREETGEDQIVAEKTIEMMKKVKLHKVAVDGFRSPGEVELFRKTFEGFKLIYVRADPDVRWKRRLEQDPKAKRNDFDSRDKRDSQMMGMREVLEMADMTVENSGPVTELHKNMDKAMHKLLSI
ncbi:MAG: AAA family ATPase [Candidatus Aenigmatarchaeota archaeon]